MGTKQKHLNRQNIFTLFLISAIIVVLFLLFYRYNTQNLLYKGDQTQKDSVIKNDPVLDSTQSANITTQQEPSPTTATTPKPVTIPVQSGKLFRIPILTYHFIGNNPNPADKARDNLSVDPETFEKQMEYLSQNGYQSISFDTLYAALQGQTTLPAKPVIITFDDGYIDFFHNAFPILRKYNLSAIAFIPTGLIGTSYYMSWDQVKEIDRTGLISFQAHSVNHPNFTSLSDSQLSYQLIESKRTIETQLGKPVNTLAYPYGVSDNRVWQSVKNAGYIGAVGTWYSTTVSEGTLYNMPRVKIPGGITIENFAARL